MSFYWRPYVPVATRRANAMREMEKLRKKGVDVQPVEIVGRTIAHSFWGKGWCQHLEKFSDFDNRLPRGRAYVRNGSVCHLQILPGRIEALVCGSELYKLAVEIKPLKPAHWKAIKKQCQGQIGSMLELLEGRLSGRVMAIVGDRETGIFPKPSEISFDCNCPDWALMCKHVAAVLYGIGNRLDQCPELLFTLRGVDAADLIDTELVLPVQADMSGNALVGDNLAELFGIDLDTDPTPRESAQVKGAKKNGSKNAVEAKAGRPAPQAQPKRDHMAPGIRKGRSGKKASAAKPVPQQRANSGIAPKQAMAGKPVAGRRPRRILIPEAPTGRAIVRLRLRAGMSRREFAEALDVTQASISRWEKTSGPLTLQIRPLLALTRLQEELLGLTSQ